MYKRILVPLDGSPLAEKVLPYARAFSASFDIPVELLKVNDIENMTPYAPPLGGGEYLEEVEKRCFTSPAKVRRVVELGYPAQVILEQAAAGEATLIAMATHGLTGMRRWLLGSVASKIVQLASQPVLLVRPQESVDPAGEVAIRTLFVPLDGSGLAEKILPHAAVLANTMRLDTRLVNVYTLPRSAYVPDAMEPQRATVVKQAADYLEAKAQQLRAEGVDRVSATAVEGDPAGEIIELAENTPDDLIAMSTHGRSGVGRWVLGSVTEKIIHSSRSPVLVIRPT